MAKVLLFQCENESEIRQILTPMKIQAVSVPKTKFHMTLEDLEKGKDDGGYFGGAYPKGSMIIMCDFTEKQLDRLLMDLRNHNVKIDYKMVMTSTNASWDVLHVYFEAQREKMMYEMAQRDRKRF
ncbi:DUF3783 domain-containing protein [uncultured Eubacterium sp.]|uniref:DUF3783 domain-containing protein n=1 Tax=uncultured Eubacterium sp. TaxID=165185 RepID=UPI0025D6E0F1|nr:DUF3783 domain-containing protein [uncultured Eubacterium sp.]